jgi:N4-(beta-N-acetylglucosaminyl)-L-asparaginase
MSTRRSFLRWSVLGATLSPFRSVLAKPAAVKPLVVSTWDSGLAVNAVAWKILSAGGYALDAVEAGAKSIEAEINCCVGLGGNPDRDGHVTLDACIMDEKYNCGSVAFLERILHPISVARKVMETTPHVLLVGEGAQKFALQNGFKLESGKLSPDAEKNWKEWLKKSEYKPVMNIEQQQGKGRKGGGPFAPAFFDDGTPNHDTMGTIALDASGRLSGACTTSGMGFKMRGRVGDSPIIGAGLYVDGEVGAVTSSGQGEEVIRIGGTHLVVEFMRNGATPMEACKKAVERLVKINPKKAKDFQVGFIAINLQGEVGAYSVNKGFSYSVTQGNDGGKVLMAESYYA